VSDGDFFLKFNFFFFFSSHFSQSIPPSGRTWVLTEKADGGNCAVWRGRVFARTHAHEADHASFDPIKDLARTRDWAAAVPASVIVFAENMTARHSIDYGVLASRLLVFGAFDVISQHWLSVAAVRGLAARMGLATVPVVCVWQQQQQQQQSTTTSAVCAEIERLRSRASRLGDAGALPEGFVLRDAAAFPRDAFGSRVFKYVREGHIQTGADWRRNWSKNAVRESAGE
jgi:hypothetical protein